MKLLMMLPYCSLRELISYSLEDILFQDGPFCIELIILSWRSGPTTKNNIKHIDVITPYQITKLDAHSKEVARGTMWPPNVQQCKLTPLAW